MPFPAHVMNATCPYFKFKPKPLEVGGEKMCSIYEIMRGSDVRLLALGIPECEESLYVKISLLCSVFGSV